MDASSHKDSSSFESKPLLIREQVNTKPQKVLPGRHVTSDLSEGGAKKRGALNMGPLGLSILLYEDNYLI